MNNFNLPEISTDLEKEEFEYRTKYRNIYIRLIIRCQNMTQEELSGYNERHHILPKCMGGSNKKSNIVLMPVRYHVIAHMVLSKAYPDNQNLKIAVFCMFSVGHEKRFSELNKMFSSREIKEIRQKIAKETSGENSPNYGLVRSEEFKEKVRQANIGKKASEETKKKMSDARSGDRNPFFGKHLTEEKKRKMSETKKRKFAEAKARGEVYGRHNRSERVKRKIVGPDGTIYNSFREAAEDKNVIVSENTIRRYVLNKLFGWKYYTEDD